MFENNVGQVDRVIRVILGVVFAGLVYYFFTNNTGITDVILYLVFAVLALIMFVTAIFGTCPIWSLLKFSTNKA